MTQPRSDTRERIQKVALKLFTEQGYDKTSLREIAEKLGVTKAALYYHFQSKEQIFESILVDTYASIKDLVDWAATLPPTLDSRLEILQRISDLVETKWRPMIRLSQTNQAPMRKLGGNKGKSNLDQLSQIFSLTCDPAAGPTAVFKARLAILGLFFAGIAPPTLTAGIDANLAQVALEVARELISGKRDGEG